MINGNACFAYFNKNWGIPSFCRRLSHMTAGGRLSLKASYFPAQK